MKFTKKKKNLLKQNSQTFVWGFWGQKCQTLQPW